MKKLLLTSTITIAVILTLASFTGGRHTQNAMAFGNSINEKMEIFKLIMETVQQRYVEEHSAEELLEFAIDGMLAKLDPHTAYMPVDNFKRWNKNFEGFQGIGIHYIFIDEKPTITGFVNDSPARNTGLLVGDRITRIDGRATSGLSRYEISNLITNSPYAKLRVKVWRPSSEQEMDFNIRRTHLNLNSVLIKTMVSPDVGYILLDRFCSNTAFELDYALESLARKGMRGLILDLRDNGGGYLSSAVEVAGRFLPAGKLIVYTLGKHPDSYQEYRASRTSDFASLPLTILVNHGTASAAEIVAGALQDWDRALIVGETSFGKGLVQSQYRFRDGSALLVTTAKYYTPLGRLIQRNYYNRTKDEYYYDAYDEYARQPEHNKLGHKTFLTPRGRKVYGGGGITPDLWVRNTDAGLSDDLLALYLNHNEQVLEFVLNLVQKRRQIADLPIEKINRQIIIYENELQEFRRLAGSLGARFSADFFRKNRDDICFLLRREIGYLTHGPLGRFTVAMVRDHQLNSAISSLDQADDLVQYQLSHVAKEKTE